MSRARAGKRINHRRDGEIIFVGAEDLCDDGPVERAGGRSTRRIFRTDGET